MKNEHEKTVKDSEKQPVKSKKRSTVRIRFPYQEQKSIFYPWKPEDFLK